MDPNTTSEVDFSAQTGVQRTLLGRIRSRVLEDGIDWMIQPKIGVVYTPAGLEKMKAALGPGVEVKKNGARGPAPDAALEGSSAALYTLLVLGTTFNGRCCRAQVEGRSEPHRAYVKPTHRFGAMTLSAGLRLEGCVKMNDELFEYHGPVPQRRGLPLPPGKEGES